MSAQQTRKRTNAETFETEIVIIGAGGAGLAAGLAAAEKGANVIIVEKQRTPGGNSALATGFFAVESPVQERMGIDVKKDDLFKIAMEYSHWEINPRIVRAWLNKSGDTVGWLEEKGVEFDMVSFFYPGQVHKVYHVPKGQGQGAIKTLVKNCEDQGIQILRQTRAKKILTSAAGNVIGVLADTGGKELKIIAKSVIITTGGYGEKGSEWAWMPYGRAGHVSTDPGHGEATHDSLHFILADFQIGR